jgi:hypothetical protein
MTYADGTPSPPVAAATATHATSLELCDHCQAPLAERQRYCVVCGARRPHADDPAARYFVESARRVRARETAASASHSAAAADAASRLRFALVLALLPFVAALGILVGRGSGSDRQLVDALRAQKAPVVNVIGAGGGAGATGTTSAGSGSGSQGDGSSNPVNGDVIARTRYGTARRLTDARVTPQRLEQSRRALQRIVDSKGRAYVDQQRNLPDQIVIP